MTERDPIRDLLEQSIGSEPPMLSQVPDTLRQAKRLRRRRRLATGVGTVCGVALLAGMLGYGGQALSIPGDQTMSASSAGEQRAAPSEAQQGQAEDDAAQQARPESDSEARLSAGDCDSLIDLDSIADDYIDKRIYLGRISVPGPDCPDQSYGGVGEWTEGERSGVVMLAVGTEQATVRDLVPDPDGKPCAIDPNQGDGAGFAWKRCQTEDHSDGELRFAEGGNPNSEAIAVTFLRSEGYFVSMAVSTADFGTVPYSKADEVQGRGPAVPPLKDVPLSHKQLREIVKDERLVEH